MTYTGVLRLGIADTPALDAFGRLRTSTPTTIFDSKQVVNEGPLIWDDAETSGAGTSSTYSQDRASTKLRVSDTTAGTRVRQTFVRHNYQSGKSQLVTMTGVFGVGAAGITQRLGIFDDDNGLFFAMIGTTFNVVRRSSVSGSPVDEATPQSAWNVDKFDGDGPSGIILNLSKALLFWIDFEWLGVGRVRMGFVVEGTMYVGHFINTVGFASVYMSTPNLPLRYEIDNDGAGPQTDLEHMCSSVMTEGGSTITGIPRTANTLGVHVDANVGGTVYAVVGIRLKALAFGCRVELEAVRLLSLTQDDFEWIIMWNPIVAGTFTHSSLSATSCVEVARGATANTVTGGEEISSGYANSSVQVDTPAIASALKLGAAIDGTPTELVLCVRPMGNNADIHGSLDFEEIQ